jgi:predicted RNase H-like nuclease
MRLIGVDGCKAGWVFASLDGNKAEMGVVAALEHLTTSNPAETIIAIDMPSGLPDRITGSGRGPEQALRAVLGERQSSVFAIPARDAIYAVTPQPVGMDALKAGHQQASAVAKSLSDPPRGVSFQAFNIFPKIREIDQFLIERQDWRERVFEVHPEGAFWQLNGQKALDTPKKIKSKPYAQGMTTRRDLLRRAGLPTALIDAERITGAGEDDQLDALACLAVAQRIARGEAEPFPDPFSRDSHGLRIAIWA